VVETVKGLFHSIRHLLFLGRTQFASDLALDLRSKNPFPLQTGPSDKRSRIILEPINGAKHVFPETASIFAHKFDSLTTGCLFFHSNFALLVEWILLVAQPNKFPFPTILMWDWKLVNDVIRGRLFDWLISRISKVNLNHFYLGKTTRQASERAFEADRTRPFH